MKQMYLGSVSGSSTKYWVRAWEEPLTVHWSGNTGKARIQRDLLALEGTRSIVDVGAVGPGPLDLWRHIPFDSFHHQVVAVDPDAAAVERARELDLPIELVVGDGYELTRYVPTSAFDIGICTQVLEHVARPVDFLRELREVLRPDGVLWLTADSAHFSGSHHGDPAWKRLLRPLAARVDEIYYDFGLTEQQLRESLVGAGFEVIELQHVNIGPLKPLYAQLPSTQSQTFMEAWLGFEARLAASGFDQPQLFRGIYASARAVQ
jgi:SAM-dependent methyltransferase